MKLISLLEEMTSLSSEVMWSIENDADRIIADSEKYRKDLEKDIERKQKELEDPTIPDMLKTTIPRFIERLRKLLQDHESYTQQDRPMLINKLIEKYKKGTYTVKQKSENSNSITSEKLINVLIDALERGSAHWYKVIYWPKEIGQMVQQDKIKPSIAIGRYILNGGELTIYEKYQYKQAVEKAIDVVDDIDAETISNEVMKMIQPLGDVNMDSLLDAINLVKKNNPESYQRILNNSQTHDDSDEFFQYAVMGKLYDPMDF